MTRQSDANGTIVVLGASGPDSELSEKLMLFGQFVGDWDILEDRFFQHDGTEVVHEGELHWRWILEGKAVQDVWMYYDKDARRPIPGGTTIRFYDPEIDAWHSVWISPIQDVVMQFIGRKIGDEIVLEGKSKEGDLVKWTFSEVKANSFQWRAEESKDDGKTWVLEEKMRIRRREMPGSE